MSWEQRNPPACGYVIIHGVFYDTLVGMEVRQVADDKYREVKVLKEYPMAERFSKRTLARHVFTTMETLAKRHRFTAANGWAQVENKSAEVNRAYGEWDMLRHIADLYDLWSVRDEALSDRD